MATSAISADRPLEGECLERSSFASLLFSKEWSACFWSLQGNLLLLYPNKEAFLRNPTAGRKTIKLTTHMHVKDVAAKTYKGFGELFKFVLDEEIDHGRSTVARFATYKEEEAHFFADNIKNVLKELRAEAGIAEEEEEEVGDEAEEEAPPAHNKQVHKVWGGLDG